MIFLASLMHDYKGEKTFASNFFYPNLYKRQRCTKKNALKTRAVRLTCLFSIYSGPVEARVIKDVRFQFFFFPVQQNAQ